MKKKLLTLGVAIISCCSYAQTNIFPSGGNVGIGTTNPENGFKLDVNGLGTIGSQGSARLYFGTSDATHAFLQARDNSINQKLDFSASSYNFNIGSIGIGTASPLSQLDLNGGMAIGTSIGYGSRPAIGSSRIAGEINGYFLSNPASDAGFLRLSAGGGFTSAGKSFIDISGYSGNSPDMSNNIVFGTAGLESMRIIGNGNVGMGTTSPDEKLTVKGNIHAAEVKVEALSAIPDYVFEPDYKLTSLTELKRYLDKNHHLPNIPSAKEIEKDGIQLGDMSMKLLKTIEELTLHVIELNNQVKLQNEKITSLENQLKK